MVPIGLNAYLISFTLWDSFNIFLRVVAVSHVLDPFFGKRPRIHCIVHTKVRSKMSRGANGKKGANKLKLNTNWINRSYLAYL